MLQMQIQLIIIQAKSREFQISTQVFEEFLEKSFVKMKQWSSVDFDN